MFRIQLALLLCVALAACGGDGGNDSDGNNGDPDVGTDAPDTTDTGDDDTGEEVGEDVPPDMDPGPVGAEVEEHPECTWTPTAERAYSAEIRWTSYGIPHITGATLGDVTYGQAYAQARDHVCTIADGIIEANSQRAANFGPGPGDANVDRDFVMKILRVREQAECTIDAQPTEVRDMLAGYVAGYNRYIADTGADGLPDPCKGAEWVQPITEADLFTFYLSLNLRASGLALAGLSVSAQPPGGSNKPEPPQEWPNVKDLSLGSNGWGIGSARTANGRGALVSNTHFPWEGGLRWYEAHLTVPGEMDIYGVSLIGVMGLNMGFNDKIAWTHTVSASNRFVFYKHELVAGDPEVYMYEGQPRRMTKRDETIMVLGDAGLEEVTRTYYRSHYGPIINIPGFGWSAGLTASYRDANEVNPGIIENFLRMAQAQDLAEFQASHRDVHGIPWVNTMYADAEGNAFYIDSTNVPNLSADGWAAWQSALENDFLTQTAWNSGIFLLDGGDPVFELIPGADGRGVVPYEEAPKLTRTDYVLNANNSHWLGNSAEPLEGYSPIYGSERTVRSFRTRQNLRYADEMGEGTVSGEDGLFDLEELENMVFANRIMTTELFYDDLVARCAGVESVDIEGDTVEIAEACTLIAEWDRRQNPDSVGAIVWREWLSGWSRTADERYTMAFDPESPVDTPTGLAEAGDTDPDPALTGLGLAVQNLGEAGLELDTPLGQAQFTTKGEQRLPIHGGTGAEGAFNITYYGAGSNGTLLPDLPIGEFVNRGTGLTEDGYPINNGSSFIMVMRFTDDGPEGRAVTTYSQSADPASPHFADQTELYGTKQMRPILFTDADILADENLTTVTISSDD
jgi:acyl-homoserine-lactone acylase